MLFVETGVQLNDCEKENGESYSVAKKCVNFLNFYAIDITAGVLFEYSKKINN